MPTTRTIANEARTTLVCVDSYADAAMAGRLFNSQLPAPISFNNFMQFLLAMEATLDQQEFPQSFTASRSFRHVSTITTTPVDESESKGKLATFALKVIFRQHASWQGTVCWLEQDREESFRSALELAILLNSALTENIG